MQLRFPSLSRIALAALLGCAGIVPATAQRPPVAGTSATGTAATDTVHGDLTADQAVWHVLNRLAFGPRPGDPALVSQYGVSEWIERQLHPERIDDRYADSLIAQLPYVMMTQADMAKVQQQHVTNQRALNQARAGSLPANSPLTDTMKLRESLQRRPKVFQQIQTARIIRASYSERQLLELMTEFWLNHFSVFAGKSSTEIFQLPSYERTIREHALGDFRSLLGAVAKSPAMLIYLDNALSQVNPGAPRLGRAPKKARNNARGLNENYGRELLELHTLGVDGGYTQQDVIEVARALTGWTINPAARGGGFRFVPAIHDAGEKHILGHRLPAGQGIKDGEMVLDIVANHPSTARFISEKLIRRFVSDTPPPRLVDSAAAVFLSTNGDIRAVLRTIFTSPEFFSNAAFRAKVKTPFEVVVSTLRAIGAPPDLSPANARLVAKLGQPIFGKRDPNGWPDTGDAWINTGSILNRINLGMTIAANRVPTARIKTLPWVSELAQAPKDQQADAVIRHILGGYVSVDTRKILLSGTNPLAQRTNRQRNRQAITSVSQMIGLALGAPEFQRR